MKLPSINSLPKSLKSLWLRKIENTKKSLEYQKEF